MRGQDAGFVWWTRNRMFGRKGVNVAIVLGIVDMLLTLICDVADFC